MQAVVDAMWEGLSGTGVSWVGFYLDRPGEQDVRELGKDYVACDPSDLSEIVIPMIDRDGQCWGVLDLDSWDINAFDEEDEAGLKLVVTAAGLLEG